MIHSPKRLHRVSVVLLAAAVLVALVSPGTAAEPLTEASFRLKKKWVELTLRRGDVPIPDATIKVFDESGEPFADGETDEKGLAVFPKPKGTAVTIEVKFDGKTADPIPLRLTHQGIEPGELLLSFGLRPCCRVANRFTANLAATAATEHRSDWVWFQAGVGSVLVVVGAGALVVARLGSVVRVPGAAERAPLEAP